MILSITTRVKNVTSNIASNYFHLSLKQYYFLKPVVIIYKNKSDFQQNYILLDHIFKMQILENPFLMHHHIAVLYTKVLSSL